MTSRATIMLRRHASTLWACTFVALFLVFTLFPLYWVLSLSLKSKLDAFAIPPIWWFEPLAEHYLKLWQHETFRQTFVNSIIVTGIGVVLALVISLPAAYVLNRGKVRGQRLLGIWLLLAYMLPEFLFIIPMFSLYNWVGLYDTHLGLALLYQVHVVPFSIWLLRSFFRELPRAIDEAALMEGCNHRQILLRIYIPCTLPGIVATSILNAIWIWNELAIALGLTFSKAQTVTVGVTSFRGYAALDWGAMTAASMVAILPMLLFALVAQKHIVKGLTLGAVKG